ncbi:hypothetical protein LTR62_006713 [Meristemomyces frigidus]|uniref:Uncharacterized protein n=1 Tax=Meristemomyces frigidus TaxID=1508187 RepID=A0AAN7THQ7_9PEZI|nr:hypothetical protein LTR62_006713 [Meristemomyces frigidus]
MRRVKSLFLKSKHKKENDISEDGNETTISTNVNPVQTNTLGLVPEGGHPFQSEGSIRSATTFNPVMAPTYRSHPGIQPPNRGGALHHPLAGMIPTAQPYWNGDAVSTTLPQHNPAELASEARRVAGYVMEQQQYRAYPGTQRAQQYEVRNPTTPEEEQKKALLKEEKKARREQNASKESVRQVRRLIREKYRLDIYLWGKRTVQKSVKPTIMEKCKKADDILKRIIFIVDDWTEELFDEGDEWELAKMIKRGIPRPGDDHVLWETSPPWDKARLRDESDNSSEDER